MIDLEKIKSTFGGDEEILLAVASEFRSQLPGEFINKGPCFKRFGGSI
jgi:hypothetical protein